MRLGDNGFTVLYIYLIRYAKRVIILHIWLQWVSRGSDLLSGLVKENLFLERSEVSRMVGAPGHARTFPPRL